jgi:pimeloyl-ACP methyl ester carboxylesterase
MRAHLNIARRLGVHSYCKSDTKVHPVNIAAMDNPPISTRTTTGDPKLPSAAPLQSNPSISPMLPIANLLSFLLSRLNRTRAQYCLLTALACTIQPAIASGRHDLGQDAAAPLSIAGSSEPSVHNLPLDNGGVQRVLYVPSAGPTRGVIVMFPGGAGAIGIQNDGNIEHGDNFLVRTRDLWRAKGYAVVIVDSIDDQSMRGLRSTPAYAAIAAKVIDFARQLGNTPVWVMGTSQGSIAAMNAASTEGTGLAGVVLTESVSVLGGSHETVFDAHPERVRIPSLIVANQNDECKVAPPNMAQDIAQSMHGTHATVLVVNGGVRRSKDNCGSLTPHGYYGIEATVIDDIVRWMQTVRS